MNKKYIFVFDSHVITQYLSSMSTDLQVKNIFHDFVVAALANHHKVVFMLFDNDKHIFGLFKEIFSAELLIDANYLQKLIIKNRNQIPSNVSYMSEYVDAILADVNKQSDGMNFGYHQLVLFDQSTFGVGQTWQKFAGIKVLHVIPQRKSLQTYLQKLQPFLPVAIDTINDPVPLFIAAAKEANFEHELRRKQSKLLESHDIDDLNNFLTEYGDCWSTEARVSFLIQAMSTASTDYLKALIERKEFLQAWIVSEKNLNAAGKTFKTIPLVELVYQYYEAENDEQRDAYISMITALITKLEKYKEHIFVSDYLDLHLMMREMLDKLPEEHEEIFESFMTCCRSSLGDDYFYYLYLVSLDAVETDWAAVLQYICKSAYIAKVLQYDTANKLLLNAKEKLKQDEADSDHILKLVEMTYKLYSKATVTSFWQSVTPEFKQRHMANATQENFDEHKTKMQKKFS